MLSKLKLFDSDSLKLLHRRVFFSITIFIFVYFISIYRISSLMLFPDFIDDSIVKTKKDIRGNIYDRNGTIIATSIESISISINPNKIKNKKELANKLGLILNLDKKKIERKLLSKNKFIWIKRNIMKTTDYKISGFNHCEFYVGNAKQTAHYYRTTMGFQLIAYRGLETGVRDRVSYVLNQNKINLVITSPLIFGGYPAIPPVFASPSFLLYAVFPNQLTNFAAGSFNKGASPGS